MKPSDATYKVVVGLGNPGARYEQTRHNIGFQLLDHIVRGADSESNLRVVSSWQRKFDAELCQVALEDRSLWLLKPCSFMNCSGGPLKAFLDFYKLKVSEIVVVHDDVDIALGSFRLKRGGGHGGHNGLRSICECLSSSEYARLRLGVGRPPDAAWDLADWVLGNFNKEEQLVVQQILDRSLVALTSLILSGLEFAQNKFNC